MPTPNFTTLQGTPTIQGVQDYIVKLIRDLNFMLGNLDTLNVGRLDAKVLIADSITAGKLAANSVVTSNLVAGAVTADKITVSQLSAISANMGTITAGSITTSAQINVGTDAIVGNNLTVGQSTTADKVISLNGAYIKSIFGSDSIGVFGAGIVTLTSLDTIVLSCLLGNVGVQSQNGTITDIVGSLNSTNSAISSLSSTVSGKITGTNNSFVKTGASQSQDLELQWYMGHFEVFVSGVHVGDLTPV